MDIGVVVRNMGVQSQPDMVLACALAAEAVGMSANGFHKALKRTAVQDHLREVQQAFVLEVEGSKAVYKARAMEVALDLLNNANSETVKARMVEFFLSDGNCCCWRLLDEQMPAEPNQTTQLAAALVLMRSAGISCSLSSSSSLQQGLGSRLSPTRAWWEKKKQQ